jgi:hypothetical protein
MRNYHRINTFQPFLCLFVSIFCRNFIGYKVTKYMSASSLNTTTLLKYLLKDAKMSMNFLNNARRTSSQSLVLMTLIKYHFALLVSYQYIKPLKAEMLGILNP